MREVLPIEKSGNELVPDKRKTRRDIEKALENLETARVLWIEILQELEEKIPHDDVRLDAKTFSFHVIRNAWLAKLDELDKLEAELKGSSEGLEKN